MYFGKNLQFLRKLHNGITQEALAEKLNVSRQTVSKWETESALPEMEKVLELCRFFSCSLDQLFLEDMDFGDDIYSPVRLETLPAFSFVSYTVISPDPETDALFRIQKWAEEHKIPDPTIIGWDFPHLSQAQINVYHLHGYTGACILPQTMPATDLSLPVSHQESYLYAALTIEEPFLAPFTRIPNGYKLLISYLQVNGLSLLQDSNAVTCFEKEYQDHGKRYMDIYIATK